MKTRIFKALITVVLLCSLALSMTGCDSLDYRKAIDRYNDRDYEAAAEMFYALGDYENCPELYTSCQYWIAVSMAEQGNFAEALPRFLKLGKHENSAQWATECNYQMAVAAFNASNFTDAENYFGEAPEYKSTQEYLRQIRWQKFFDMVAEAPLYLETEGKVCSLTANVADNQLKFYIGSRTDKEFTFHNDLTLTLSRSSTIADFTATDAFEMDYVDGQIGSNQEASGKVDITTCTPDTPLVVETFEKTVTDNSGETTTSHDPADSLMNDTMLSDFRDLMTFIPQMISEAGFTLTLHDIGFSSL